MRQADDLRRLDLREPPPLDSFADLGGKLGLDQHFFCVRPIEVCIDTHYADTTQRRGKPVSGREDVIFPAGEAVEPEW